MSETDTQYYTPPEVLREMCEQLQRELAEAREQRDTLADALEMVRDADEDCHKDGLKTIPPVARHKIDMALATLKGGEA